MTTTRIHEAREAARYSFDQHRPKARTFLPFLLPLAIYLIPTTKDAR